MELAQGLLSGLNIDPFYRASLYCNDGVELVVAGFLSGNGIVSGSELEFECAAGLVGSNGYAFFEDDEYALDIGTGDGIGNVEAHASYARTAHHEELLL